ncbi:MAG: glycerophosphodiester phosphodiesterase family protein [Desulfobacterales bacterium]
MKKAEDRKKSAIPKLEGKTKPYVMAHRGNSSACPENTLAAFRRAITDGADIIETDLHLTRDDVFVCIHDDAVDRTTDGSGKVSDMTLADIKHLSAGIGHPNYLSESVPTLQETASVIPENVALALELKTDRFLEERVIRHLVSELERSGIFKRTVALSFSLPRLETVTRVCPELYTGWITLTGNRPIHGPDMLGPYWPLLIKNPLYVMTAHRRNQAVCPLDTVPDSRLWFYLLLRCDAVITNNTEITCNRLKKLRDEYLFKQIDRRAV